MSKHEIRLRRQRLTSHGSERFRNYGAVLERHTQEQRMRKVFRVFGYFLVILIIVVLIVIVMRVEKKVAPKGPAQTALQGRCGLKPNSKKELNHALKGVAIKALELPRLLRRGLNSELNKDFSPAPLDHNRSLYVSNYF